MLQAIDISNFTAGELSPRLKGRIDHAKYFAGADTLLNMVVMPQGGATRRPGLMYVANQKDQANRCRLRRFIFSTVQAYMLEFSNLNVRVYMNDAPVAGPVDIVTPYTNADLAALKFCQSADTLFIVHPNYPPATLTRSSHTVWTYSIGGIAFRDGPYLPVNITGTTLTPSAVSGAGITITASAPTFNGGQGFINSDVGRFIRIKVVAAWGWVKVTGRTNSVTVTADVQPAVIGNALGAAGVLDGTAATTNWALGSWSGTTGYPYAVAFWQERLSLGGSVSAPNVIAESVTGDFTNMAPSKSDGTVTDAHAMQWTIADDEVNAIQWLSPAGSAQAMQLGIGTTGGEHILQAASASQALTPTSIQEYRETVYGSAPNVQPLRIGKSLIFPDRAARKLREWSFFWQLNGYNAADLTQYSEHVTRAPIGALASADGIGWMAFQLAPYSVIWAGRNDGVLLSFTYDRDQQVFAPCRHLLGGQYYGGPPVVESGDIIPSPDGTYDELWLSVLRTINGTPTRFIEVMTRYFDGDSPDAGFFVDAGLSSALTFPGATLTPSGFTNKAVVTDPPSFQGSGTLSADANVFAANSVNRIVRMNGGKAVITAYTDAQHVTAQVLQRFLNLAPATVNNWSMTALSTSFSGLSHLNGETAAILGDGAVYTPQTVTAGAVQLDLGGASYATIGLPYVSGLVTMPWEPVRAVAIASQGKVKRIDTLYARFHESLGCQFGTRTVDSLTGTITEDPETLQSRSAADPMNSAPPLFSGPKKLVPRGASDEEGQIFITQSEPLPLTVLAIFAMGDVGEMGQ